MREVAMKAAALCGLVGALLSPVGAQAQAPSQAAPQATSEAPWYGVSLGAGSSRFTCDACSADRDGGPMIRLTGGEVLRPGLRVGLMAGAWTHERDEVRESLTHAGVVARLDLAPRSWLHLTGGLGWVGWRADPFAYDALDLTVGGGWDLPLTGRWALTNDVLLHSASFGRMRNDGDTALREVSLSLISFEVGVIRR